MLGLIILFILISSIFTPIPRGPRYHRGMHGPFMMHPPYDPFFGGHGPHHAGGFGHMGGFDHMGGFSHPGGFGGGHSRGGGAGRGF